MDEESVQELYTWIDEISLSRPKRNIARDFSDGVLAAEIVGNYIPAIVDLHNYTPANSTQQKRTNWDTLNRKVFKKIDFTVPSNIITGIVTCKPGVIEIVLYQLRIKIMGHLSKKKDEVEDVPYSEAYPAWDGPHLTAVPPHPLQQQQFVGQPAAMGGMHPQMPQMPHMSPHTLPPAHNALSHPYYSPHHGNTMHHPVAQPAQPFDPSPNKKTTRLINAQLNGSSKIVPMDNDQFSVRKKKPVKKKKPTVSSTTSADNPRSQSMPSSLLQLDHESRIYIQEKEQALLESHETIQILKSKITRLEHLLHLKDLRIEDLDMKLQTAINNQKLRGTKT